MARLFACIAAGAFCVSMGCAQLIDIEDLPELPDSSPPGDRDASQPGGDAGATRCAGMLINDIALRYETAIYGSLDVYYDEATGSNCAMTRAVDIAEGSATWIEVELIRCVETSSGSVCTTDVSESDAGPYSYYAGPVFLEARGTCIHARGVIAYDGHTVEVETSPAAWHCL